MLRIFLSYAHEDYEYAKRLYDFLDAVPAVDVWFDKESLSPGQRWEVEIRKAIRASRFFLLLLSKNSTEKKGYYQREIRQALKVLEEYPDNETYLIPARLDKCELHFEELQALQYVDLFPDWNTGLQKIYRAFQTHRRTEFLSSNPSVIRFKVHQARFTSDPTICYFLTVTNLSDRPIEITHLWYEDVNSHIPVRNNSRLLPKRLEINETWESWISLALLPEKLRHNCYDFFRVRLSTGDIFISSKEDSVPPFGAVPGGGILQSDIEKLKV